MTGVSFFQGISSELPATATAGALYFLTDTQEIKLGLDDGSYLDYSVGNNEENTQIYYGISDGGVSNYNITRYRITTSDSFVKKEGVIVNTLCQNFHTESVKIIINNGDEDDIEDIQYRNSNLNSSEKFIVPLIYFNNCWHILTSAINYTLPMEYGGTGSVPNARLSFNKMVYRRNVIEYSVPADFSGIAEGELVLVAE